MSFRTTIAVLLAFPAIVHAQYTPPDPAGFQGIIVETYYESDSLDATDTDGSLDLSPGGETTYRVFVDLLPGYKLLTVGGFTNHEIQFETTTSFYHNDDRGEAWANDINDIHLDKNTVAIDSWLSFGATSDDLWGVLKTEDPDGAASGVLFPNDGGSEGVSPGLLQNSTAAMGIALTTADGVFSTGTPPPAITSVGAAPTCFNTPGGNAYSSDNFAWAVLGGMEGPTAENRILIGQFTTDGTFEFCLNLWVKIPDSLVCPDVNCHDILEFYATIVPSDTLGGGIPSQNKFTHPTLCFASQQVDCLGIPGGTALPGSSCDDGNPDTDNDVYDSTCACVGEDCEGVLGGSALPGAPCDDGDSTTINDTWQTGCLCEGTVGIDEGGDRGMLTINVRPNPTRDQLFLDIQQPAGGRITLEVCDVLGQAVITRDLGMQHIKWSGALDLSRLNSGAYFLRVVGGGTELVRRISKF